MVSQAYVQLAKMEREQAEREQQLKEEERRRKIEEKKRKKRMLEAAFDGDLNEIRNVLKEVCVVLQFGSCGVSSESEMYLVDHYTESCFYLFIHCFYLFIHLFICTYFFLIF